MVPFSEITGGKQLINFTTYKFPSLTEEGLRCSTSLLWCLALKMHRSWKTYIVVSGKLFNMTFQFLKVKVREHFS